MTGKHEGSENLAGRLEGGSHCLNVRVYYEDTDFTGIVYHASYIRFMERGRSDFLRLLGISHNELISGKNGSSLAFAVRNLEVEYLKPAKIDDVLQVWTNCNEISGARIELTQEIHRDSTKLLQAKVGIVVIDNRGKITRVPAEISDLLKSVK